MTHGQMVVQRSANTLTDTLLGTCTHTYPMAWILDSGASPNLSEALPGPARGAARRLLPQQRHQRRAAGGALAERGGAAGRPPGDQGVIWEGFGLVGNFFGLELGFFGLVGIFGLVGMRLDWFGFVGIGWEFLRIGCFFLDWWGCSDWLGFSDWLGLVGIGWIRWDWLDISLNWLEFL